ncbi:MAG: hypothetical protein AAGC54_08990 [Cyanobacteria bacterium P01_F01_bin.4]
MTFYRGVRHESQHGNSTRDGIRVYPFPDHEAFRAVIRPNTTAG